MNGAVEGRGRRRRHSAQFKAQVVQACEPGTSVAAVALEHGLNANLVRRWLKSGDGGVSGAVALKPTAWPTSAFMPVQLQAPSPATDIRLEMRRGAATVIVSWPVQEASACAGWLHDWLR